MVHVHRVAIPIFPGFQPLDVVGPHEVFIGANDAMRHLGIYAEHYAVDLVAGSTDPVMGESGLSLVPAKSFGDVTSTDTLLVPGGTTTRRRPLDGELVQWVKTTAVHSERVASVCTGTFLIAAAGLCTGRRVTTHWAYAAQLAVAYPDITVDPDPIFVRDRDLWTSAGVTAGVDLALAMVEADRGPSVAQLVARHLVVYLRRPGGQSQFGAPVWSEAAETQPIREACDRIHRTPNDDLRVGHLAASVGLSERHFTRLFRAEVGETPARYIDRVRVDAARVILETETVGLDAVAARCGFNTTESLRRAFHRRLGISPAAYRRQSTIVGEETP